MKKEEGSSTSVDFLLQSLQGLGYLIRARGFESSGHRGSAGDAIESGYGIVDIHPLKQHGGPLEIAIATSDGFERGYLVAFIAYFEASGADILRSVGEIFFHAYLTIVP